MYWFMRFLYVSVMFIIVLCDFNMCSGFKRKLFFLSKSSFVFWCFNPIALSVSNRIITWWFCALRKWMCRLEGYCRSPCGHRGSSTFKAQPSKIRTCWEQSRSPPIILHIISLLQLLEMFSVAGCAWVFLNAEFCLSPSAGQIERLKV